ncbi:CGNR zinc finger domain-containing protein [Microbispora sp. ATCC PTA-5024]|uniref:CGNR zinc finger domain-containing protein n=1 Tax=Microbispora sp. ATCC PTA-5024 TaxID=316330 RepID=UPI0003DCFFA1|nr:CGNR zinc finger domain-containing protein [Microbispora sp. ATCC PTA-5024]ETK31964.1 hypothetical protein MPTA5024_32255 [Microbispora sp. ATCC PTA-5024]
MAVDRSAPAELLAVEAFLNTLDERAYTHRGTRHAGGDQLTTPAALSAWLAREGLVPPGTRAGRDDLSVARDLRAALRASLAGRIEPPDEDAVAEANTTLGWFPLRLGLTPGGTPRLDPDGGGVLAEALGGIVAAVARAAARGSWNRLRMCAAPDCHWVFYDTSRSGGGRWCSMAVCGNRAKTRRYRERHVGDEDASAS